MSIVQRRRRRLQAAAKAAEEAKQVEVAKEEKLQAPVEKPVEEKLKKTKFSRKKRSED